MFLTNIFFNYDENFKIDFHLASKFLLHYYKYLTSLINSCGILILEPELFKYLKFNFIVNSDGYTCDSHYL
ncbi:hypothetical protein BpHYR1_017221 [Brachionus plicatilis]|uniref:Uncharacterized protein n=1 Tax=Brachionus plicatilis TaxID=10195 RepID=A0A3M7QSC5_BRAPC|nr:hypothetical protein BpHYR1_017221 [Brachionus plicatilis]